MKVERAVSTVGVSIILAAANVTFAHHSRAAFDMTRNVTYQGFVKEYRWENPHSHIVIVVGTDARDPSTVGTWDVEASSTSIMVSEGWKRNSFKVGDPITVVAHPSKMGTREVLLFYAINPDGSRLYRAKHRYPSEAE